MLGKLACIGLASLCYVVFVSIRRVFFSRISHIPGPWFASVTYLYHAWYELWPHQGQFMMHLATLHEKYGPIIRIGPDEVHIKDTHYIDEVYPSDVRRKRNKSTLFFWMVGTNEFGDHSAGATIDHDVHRAKRSSMAPYFSARMVQDLEPRILGKVQLLRDKILSMAGSPELLEMRNAVSGLTLDVISEYSFGRSFGALDTGNFGKPLNNILLKGVKVHPFARIFRPLAIAIFRAPKWMMPSSEILDNSIKYDKLISDMTQVAFDDATGSGSHHQHDGFDKSLASSSRTIVHSMVQSDQLSPEDKTFLRLKADAMVLIGAGTETTARTLATALYYIHANAAVYARVLREVRSAMPDADSPIPPVTKLRPLPYLTAVLEESLRIAHGVAGRLSRIAPEEDLVYRGLRIPRGVTFSQSMYYVHSDPEVFPEPDKFHPERFMGDSTAAVTARKHLQPFGKGTRNCLGINLAWSELYLTVAALVGSVRMDLVDTTIRDVTIVKEYFVGYLPEDSKGIRFRVLGKA